MRRCHVIIHLIRIRRGRGSTPLLCTFFAPFGSGRILARRFSGHFQGIRLLLFRGILFSNYDLLELQVS